MGDVKSLNVKPVLTAAISIIPIICFTAATFNVMHHQCRKFYSGEGISDNTNEPISVWNDISVSQGHSTNLDGT